MKKFNIFESVKHDPYQVERRMFKVQIGVLVALVVMGGLLLLQEMFFPPR